MFPTTKSLLKSPVSGSGCATVLALVDAGVLRAISGPGKGGAIDSSALGSYFIIDNSDMHVGGVITVDGCMLVHLFLSNFFFSANFNSA